MTIKDFFKKTICFIKQQKWLFEHGLAATVAVSSTLSFSWLVRNWEKETVVYEVKMISDFLDSYLHFIEPVLTIIIFIFFVTVGRVIKHYRKGSMAIASGMFFFSPNFRERQVIKSEKFLRNESTKCVHIQIMGASGWNTFGHPDSPLHEGLQICGKAQIILLNPLSKSIIQRAENIDQGIKDYKQEIISSLKYLHNLRQKGDNPNRIQVRMYQSYPGWKFVILGRYIWTQWYPSDDHVRNSPCYAFQRVPNEQRCLYSQLFAQFNRRWDSYHLGRYNFDNGKIEFYAENGLLIKEISIPIS